MIDLSPELKEIDKEVFEFQRLFGVYLNDSHNPYAYRFIKERISALRKKTDSIKPSSRFEEFVLEHVAHGLEVQDKTSSFIMDTDSGYSTPQIVDIIHGDGMYGLLEDKVRNYDGKGMWQFHMLESESMLNSIDVDREKPQEEIRKLIPGIKKDILSYAVRHGFLPEGFDFEIEKIPANSKSDRSNWRHALKRVELGNGIFSCESVDGKIRINAASAYSAMFHEVIGHAAHQFYSQNMPLTLQFEGFNAINLVSGAVTEGLAVDRQNLSIPYLKENAERLGLNESDIEKESTCLLLAIPSFSLIHSFMKEREIREKGFDVLEYARNLSLGSRASWFYTEKPDLNFLQALLNEMKYFSGDALMKSARKRLSDKLGEDFMRDKEKKVNQAMSTGKWSWKAYSKFLDYALKENPSFLDSL